LTSAEAFYLVAVGRHYTMSASFQQGNYVHSVRHVAMPQPEFDHFSRQLQCLIVVSALVQAHAS